MKITKIGHCCLLIEVEGKRILTDPGSFTAEKHILENIDLVLITHEHADHIHVDSLKSILDKNPSIEVVCNAAVGRLLDQAGLAYQVLEGTEGKIIADITLQAFDAQHVEIFEDYGQVQNTGYFIADRLFYPGDAYAVPERSVEILALPVAGPWCRVADVVRYAFAVNPQKAFPVHDGLLNEQGLAIQQGVVQAQLSAKNIRFLPLKEAQSLSF